MSGEWGHMKPDELYQKRDIMLAEIHKDVGFLTENLKTHKADLNDHKVDDENFQKSMENKVGWILKIGVAVLVIVAGNGGMSAIKTLFHV